VSRLPELAAAESAWVRAVEKDPQCEEGYVDLGLVQRARGSHDEALANLKRALASNAQSVEGLLGMASILLDQGAGKLGLAELTLQLARQRGGKDAATYDLSGVIAARRGDAQLARACFAWALELDPSRFSAHMNLAQLALEHGDMSAAEAGFARAARLRPSDAAAAAKLQLARTQARGDSVSPRSE
jgi:Flp pilus assembly protein TadD